MKLVRAQRMSRSMSHHAGGRAAPKHIRHVHWLLLGLRPLPALRAQRDECRIFVTAQAPQMANESVVVASSATHAPNEPMMSPRMP